MDDNPWIKRQKPKDKDSDSHQKEKSFWEDFSKKKGKKGWNPPPISPEFKGPWPILALGIFFVLWLASGFFHVQEGDAAAVLRFGKLDRVVLPGLRYKLPFPIEEAQVARIAVWNKFDGGVSVKGASDDQSLILTTDENMVHVNYTVMWKIRDIIEFLFNGREPENTIRLAAESSIREVIGQTQARLVLTEDRERIAAAAQELLQKILDQYKVGIQVISVQLQRVEPPKQVIEAFNDMQASIIDADRIKNEAEAYKNDKVPRARGEAQQILNKAKGYQQKVLLSAEGEVARFQSILEGSKGNRDVAKMMLFSRIVPPILSNTPKTIIDKKVNQGFLPHMNIAQPSAKPSSSKGEQK